MSGIGKFGTCGTQDRCTRDERCALYAGCAAGGSRARVAAQMRWALAYIARAYGGC